MGLCTLEQLPWRLLCKVLLYVHRYSYLILVITYKCPFQKTLTHSKLECLQIDSWVKVTWHGSWFPLQGISLKCSYKYFLIVHIILYPPPKHFFFQNCQFFGNWEPSDMYISLSILYKSGTLEACISFHSDICFLHNFCLGMFNIDSGWSDMAWQMNPLHQGRNFIAMLQTIFSACNSLSIPKFFQNSQFFSNWEPSEISISLSCLYKCETMEAYISVHIDLF